MVVYDMQAFGGLEEYAINLAFALQQQGHHVSILSTTWVSPDNQYLVRMRAHGVTFVDVPKFLSLPASDWEYKEKTLTLILRIFTPLTFVLGLFLFLLTEKSRDEAQASAYRWLRGKLSPLIKHDWRKPLTLILLNWWRLTWHPDVLHLHGYTTNLLFVINWAYARKLPIVYEEHQTPDTQFDWWRDFNQIINKASIVVAVSEKSADALQNVCGVTRPIFVQGPPVSDPITNGWKVDNKPDGSTEITYITSIARLYVTKGLKFLLDAIPIVRLNHSNVMFRIYGDGPLRKELEEQAAMLGLDPAQIFQGTFPQSKLPVIMEQTDIFVLPSILEGQPLTLVEAMAYGCPIVATCVGGIPELIADEINGLLCQPSNPTCLAHKINALIEDTDLRSKLGMAARISYEQGPFQPRAVAENFVSIYQQAIQIGA